MLKRYFVDLIDEDKSIIEEPDEGYFQLLSKSFPDNRVITYESVINNYSVILKDFFDKVLDSYVFFDDELIPTIIRLRFGLDNGVRLNIDDTAKNCHYYKKGSSFNEQCKRIFLGYSKTTVNNAIRKVERGLRRPVWRRQLENMFILKQVEYEYITHYDGMINYFMQANYKPFCDMKQYEIMKMFENGKNPIVRVTVTTLLKERMEEKNIITYKDLLTQYDKLPKNLKADADLIITEVNVAKTLCRL